MEFDRIILCTDAPKNQGLAYYYFLAFCDVSGKEKVFIIDEGSRDYGAGIISRGSRRLKHQLGLLSNTKFLQIENTLADGRNLVILFNNADLTQNDIENLAKDASICLVNYLSDHPYGIISSNQDNILKTIPLFELIFTFASDLIPVLYQLGAKRVERVPFGYCKYTHMDPSQPINIEFPNKVFYFGTWSEEIENWIRHLTSFDLEIEGNSWHKAKNERLRKIVNRKKPNTGHQMALMARKAGVVVNFTRARHGCFHTMKTFELTAAGACVVTNFSQEQLEFFKDDESMVYFNTVGEMIQKIDYLLRNQVANYRIRAGAMTNAMEHSYHNRCQKILEILEKINL